MRCYDWYLIPQPMKKLILLLVLAGTVFIALYNFVPAFRHHIYYQYFVLTRPHTAGGPCGPNCNGYDEFPPGELSYSDTLPDFLRDSINRIHVSGIVHDVNGTPAPGILLYIFQANTSGIYPKTGRESGADSINGYLRSWLVTDAQGRYSFYTNRPGAYPGTKRMAHIHCIVKEPNINAYTLPDFVFPNDPNLTRKARHTSQENNGGLLIEAGNTGEITEYRRNIYLGRNVINYPKGK